MQYVTWPRPEKKRCAVVVGECPAPRWDGRAETICAFSAGFRRFWKLAGFLHRSDYLLFFDRANVVGRIWSEREEPWPREEAAEAAEKIMQLARGRDVFLLGARVARAFNVAADVPWLSSVLRQSHEHLDFGLVEQVHPPTRLHKIPHPSGRNRWWNDRENERAAARYLREQVRRLRERVRR